MRRQVQLQQPQSETNTQSHRRLHLHPFFAWLDLTPESYICAETKKKKEKSRLSISQPRTSCVSHGCVCVCVCVCATMRLLRGGASLPCGRATPKSASLERTQANRSQFQAQCIIIFVSLSQTPSHLPTSSPSPYTLNFNNMDEKYGEYRPASPRHHRATDPNLLDRIQRHLIRIS